MELLAANGNDREDTTKVKWGAAFIAKLAIQFDGWLET